MKIIEKLGGYESAKSIRDMNVEEFDGDASGVMIHYMGHSFLQEDLELALLEHRRENNIFEVGDLVVHPKFDNKKIYEIIEIKGDLFTVFYDRNSHSFRSDLRHATPSEIKAGHRIDDTTDHVTDIRNHVSPSTRVVDL